jgi:hypothetical protein
MDIQTISALKATMLRRLRENHRPVLVVSCSRLRTRSTASAAK